MNVTPKAASVSRSRGITIIEILMVISLAAILISFAIPSVGVSAARSEMKAAVENLEFSIDAARKAARSSGRPVVLHLDRRSDEPDALMFTSPDSPQSDSALDLPEYRLPAAIRIETDRDDWLFDNRGLVDDPGQLVLVSEVDESITSVVEVGP